MFPLLVDNLKSEDYFYAQKKEHEKENSIKICFLLQVVWWLCAACFTIMKQAHWTVWHFRMLKHWPKAENDDAHCYGYGSVDCRSYKVKYKISGLSLE